MVASNDLCLVSGCSGQGAVVQASSIRTEFQIRFRVPVFVGMYRSLVSTSLILRKLIKMPSTMHFYASRDEPEV
jgi:hypothetical protein